MPRALALATGLSLLLSSASAQASFFRVQLRSGSQVSGGRVFVRTTLTNVGDEAMRSVHVSVWFNGREQSGPTYPQLDVAQHVYVDLLAGDAPAQPGTYTAVITTRYCDRNGHPFTSLATVPVCTAETPDTAPVRGTLNRSGFRRSGELVLAVHSLADAPVDVTARLVLPDELAGDTRPQTFPVAPGGRVTRLYPVRSAWAVANSEYAVFALLEYTWQGQHLSVIVPGSATVLPPWELSERAAARLWWIPAGLAALYLALQFRVARPRAAA